MPTWTRCPTTGGGQRRERTMSMAAATANTLTGVSGVCLGQILGTGIGGVHDVMAATTTRMRRVDHIPTRGGRRHTSWRQDCVPLAATGGRQRKERAMFMTVATRNMLMGVSGVRIGCIPEIGDGRNSSTTATMTTMMRRADCIPPLG